MSSAVLPLLLKSKYIIFYSAWDFEESGILSVTRELSNGPMATDLKLRIGYSLSEKAGVSLPMRKVKGNLRYDVLLTEHSIYIDPVLPLPFEAFVCIIW